RIDSSSGWIRSDLTGTVAHPLDPQLTPANNYGGSFITQVPMPGSPARGAGSIALIPAGISTDERGFARVVNGKVDIGAVEMRTSVVTVTPPARQDVTAGVSETIHLGSVAETGGIGHFGVEINWSDGSDPAFFGMRDSGSLGAMQHTFINTGTLHGTILVTDGWGDVSKFTTFTVVAAPAPLRTIIVNTTANHLDPAGSKTVSLGDAIAIANSSFGPITIGFDPAIFAGYRTIATGIALTFDKFGIITIIGPAGGLTLKGQGISIGAGVNAVISHLTVTGSSVNGGITNAGTLNVSHCVFTGNQSLSGGGISNSGTMTVSDCVISKNSTGFVFIYEDKGPGY